MATGKIVTIPKVAGEDIANKLSKTSGSSSVQWATFSRRGNLACLIFNIKATADTTNGNDAWIGTIAQGYRPAFPAKGLGYSGGTTLIVSIDEYGNLSVRVCGGTFPNTWSATIEVPYMID